MATGLLTLAVARRADPASWAGRSIRVVSRSPQRAPGVLLTACGFAWFVADWNNEDAGPSAVFTAGLAFSTVGPALVGHALLRYSYKGTGLYWFDRFAVAGGLPEHCRARRPGTHPLLRSGPAGLC